MLFFPALKSTPYGIFFSSLVLTQAVYAQAGSGKPAAAAPLVVNVKDAKFGARGDGTTDDTNAIQKAINAVAGTGGTVRVPDGVYRINAAARREAGVHGLEIRGAMTLSLSSGATLQAIPNSSENYVVVMVFPGARDVNIIGGTIMGERGAHGGKTGEWGMGVSIVGAHHISVDGVISKENWGDGFYVSDESSDVHFVNVVADHNRRQGLSIVSVDGMTVKDSTFSNTAGTLPEAGIDIEPNPGQAVRNVVITGSRFINNAGGGIQSGVPVADTGAAHVSGIVFDHNTVAKNGVGPIDGGSNPAVRITNQDGAKVTNNTIIDNTGGGIHLLYNATHTTLTGNTVSGTIAAPGGDPWTGTGILLEKCAHSRVSGNTVTNNSAYGIVFETPDDSVTVENNVVSGNGKTP